MVASHVVITWAEIIATFRLLVTLIKREGWRQVLTQPSDLNSGMESVTILSTICTWTRLIQQNSMLLPAYIGLGRRNGGKRSKPKRAGFHQM